MTIQYKAVENKFDAKCPSPFVPVDASKFPGSAGLAEGGKLNQGPCLIPIPVPSP